MTWINNKPPDDPAFTELVQKTRSLYPPEYGTPVDAIPGDESIVMSHTLIPQALHHAFALLGELLQPTLPLERRHHEMIATVVSAVNRCFY